ncbi:type II toxin-antitoxin system PemK/MazF family toxin [Nocardia ninae]|uniref:Putative toxin n=1 Tax=Nocardia ninae NBRC 108245 TaxID=1210091 RepID=A0A511MJ23_9NOCA|nr:type II toxin-antitoxin system PemK/MazF family toxin [Nocardia ninae]GEM40652.1 putative toxin [Nocardia ninae NBRC 108245]
MVNLIRGAVHRVDLGDAKRGHEQRGRRLGIIVSPTDLLSSVVTIVPTSTSARSSVFRPVTEIDGRETLLLVDQVRTIDLDYLGKFVEMLNRTDVAALDDALGRYLGIA